MIEEEFRKTISGKENRYCRVFTEPRSYEVVFIKENKPADDLLMIVRATGKLREELEPIATETGEKLSGGVFGIKVDSIVSIEFDEI